MKIAIYPGSFDPITNGHIDIIDRASSLFDKIIIGVTNNNPNKSSFFSIDERIDMIIKSISKYPNVEVEYFDGLLIHFAKKNQAISIVRGLRALSDFEFEFKMALMNRNLDEDISTVFMMPHEKYTHISSSLVREVSSLGGDVNDYVPKHVSVSLNSKYEK
tara:strand:+ start:175 stop:657 length:483 start_codon:yes stop_codon:yes gene_type:complete